MWLLIAFSFSVLHASTESLNLYGLPKEATLLERPFQAAIMKNDYYRCSAALISEKCVLTACSCVMDSTMHLDGTEKLQDNYTVVTYTRYIRAAQINWAIASELFILDGCDTQSNENDAAIICSKSKLVGLPVTIVKEKTKENVRAIVSGWGLSVEGQEPIQGHLHRAYMKVISLDECRLRYAGVREVPDSALCAVATDDVRGFCKGDIGAPLTHGEGLIGIAVTSFGCGRLKYPGIFTNISTISESIRNIVTNYESEISF